MEILREHKKIIIKIDMWDENPQTAASIYIERRIAPNAKYEICKGDNRSKMAAALAKGINAYRNGDLIEIPDDGWQIDEICDACANESCYRKSERAVLLRKIIW